MQALQSAFAARFLTIYPARVPMLTSELDVLAWDDKAQERGIDKPVKFADHACDALRYWCMNRRPPRLTMAPQPKPRGL